jgi:ADP-ribose pyrophosphatase
MSVSELLLQLPRFSVVRKRYTTLDGTERTHDSLQHPGAVTIVPMVDADHVCLIRNRRIAVDRTLIELPAGTLEPGEEPLKTAYRELTEETGYTASKVEPLCQFFMSPGIQNERMHLFVATGLQSGSMHLDAGEQIETLIVPWDEAMSMCRDGSIQDAKSLVGLLFYDDRRRRVGP